MEFMMLNRRILMGLACSSLGLGLALPASAQQVMLTPGGTLFQPLPQAPVAAPDAKTVIPGVDLTVQPDPYVFVPAPGTGIDGNTPLDPGKNYTQIIGISLPNDPDVLIGGPGGTRYSDLIKTDNPSRVPTSEEIAEAVRRGEAVYATDFSASRGDVNNSVIRQTFLNPPLLPSTKSDVSSPLSNSRILPGF